MKKKNHIESKLLTGSVLICKMIKAGWTNNKMLLVLWMQDGKSLQSGQFSPSDLQRGLSVSRSKLGPRVRRERAHLRLPLPGWMPDVPRLWKGHGKRGLWTESVIRNNSACLLSHLFKECERQCVVFPYALNSGVPSALWRVCTTCLSSAQRLYWIFGPSLKLPSLSLFENANLVGSVKILWSIIACKRLGDRLFLPPILCPIHISSFCLLPFPFRLN